MYDGTKQWRSSYISASHCQWQQRLLDDKQYLSWIAYQTLLKSMGVFMPIIRNVRNWRDFKHTRSNTLTNLQKHAMTLNRDQQHMGTRLGQSCCVSAFWLIISFSSALSEGNNIVFYMLDEDGFSNSSVLGVIKSWIHSWWAFLPKQWRNEGMNEKSKCLFCHTLIAQMINGIGYMMPR